MIYRPQPLINLPRLWKLVVILQVDLFCLIKNIEEKMSPVMHGKSEAYGRSFSARTGSIGLGKSVKQINSYSYLIHINQTFYWVNTSCKMYTPGGGGGTNCLFKSSDNHYFICRRPHFVKGLCTALVEPLIWRTQISINNIYNPLNCLMRLISVK